MEKRSVVVEVSLVIGDHDRVGYVFEAWRSAHLLRKLKEISLQQGKAGMVTAGGARERKFVRRVVGENQTKVIGLHLFGLPSPAQPMTAGQVYLLRGAAVVPQLLQQNSAASLISSSTSSMAHGSGNTLLTLTGSNFVPGVAVTWNGSYRTTTIIDATHVTVAIPASDLTASGSSKLMAVNPGSGPSDQLMISVQ